MAFAIVVYCGFNGVFSKDATMDFDWGQGKFFSNLAIFKSCGFV
jgi:hypothetical protein